MSTLNLSPSSQTGDNKDKDLLECVSLLYQEYQADSDCLLKSCHSLALMRGIK